MKNYNGLYLIFNISKEDYKEVVKFLCPVIENHDLVIYNTIKTSDLSQKQQEVAIFLLGYRDGLELGRLIYDETLEDLKENPDDYFEEDDEGEEWKGR